MCDVTYPYVKGRAGMCNMTHATHVTSRHPREWCLIFKGICLYLYVKDVSACVTWLMQHTSRHVTHVNAPLYLRKFVCIHMWRTLACVPWLMQRMDTSRHPCEWSLIFKGICLCSYVRDVLACVTWLMQTYTCTHRCVWWQDPFIRVTWCMPVCDMTHPHVRHDSYK